VTSFETARVSSPRPKLPDLSVFKLSDPLFDDADAPGEAAADEYFGRHISLYFPEHARTYRGIVGKPVNDDPDGTHMVYWDDNTISPVFMTDTNSSYEDKYNVLSVKPSQELSQFFRNRVI
jgi:hypothetical protein